MTVTQPLSARRCRPQRQGVPEGVERQTLLAQLDGWVVVDEGLERRFAFNDYARMMSFVNAVAWIAQLEDHHPELQVGWGRCTVRWRTHSVGGLSINDFICAAKVDALHP